MAITKAVTGHAETIPSAREQTKRNSHVMPLIITFSLLSGPVLFFIYNTVNGAFENSEKFLILFTFMVMGFELTWIVYGLVTWIQGAFYISDEYSDFVV